MICGLIHVDGDPDEVVGGGPAPEEKSAERLPVAFDLVLQDLLAFVDPLAQAERVP
jgi:hypothetical protein